MKIIKLLEKLNWSIYRFAKKADISYSTAHRTCTESHGQTANVKITKLWLEAEIKLNDQN